MTNILLAAIGLPAFAIASLPAIGLIVDRLGFHQTATDVLMAFFKIIGG